MGNGDNVCVIVRQRGDGVGGKIKCFGSRAKDVMPNIPANDMFVQVLGTDKFHCGITQDQELKCWAHQGFKRNFQESVPGLFTQITSTSNYICGLTTEGYVRCTGFTSKFDVERSDVPFEQVDCSDHHCCALDINGHAHCWGTKHYKEALTPPSRVVDVDGSVSVEPEEEDGYEDEPTTTPHTTDGIPEVFVQISVAVAMSCGIRERDRAIQCWGSDSLHRDPYIVLDAPDGGYRQLSAGAIGVCGIRVSNDMLECVGSRTPADPIKHIRGRDTEWDQVRVGGSNICAVTMDSVLHCTGGLRNSIPSDLEVF